MPVYLINKDILNILTRLHNQSIDVSQLKADNFGEMRSTAEINPRREDTVVHGRGSEISMHPSIRSVNCVLIVELSWRPKRSIIRKR